MTDSTSAGSSKTMDFVQALNVAEGVFEQYRQDQPKWWKRMDGTPILNDVAVRMAEAFRDEIKRLQQVGVRLAAEKFELKGQLNEARGGHETLPGHDLRVMCPAEVDVKAIDKALGPGWVHRLATGLQSSRAPRQRPERESDALLAAAMLTGEMGSDTPKASEPPMFRHDWQMLPGGSYQCLRCGTQCLDAHDAKLCPVNAKSEVEQHG